MSAADITDKDATQPRRRGRGARRAARTSNTVQWLPELTRGIPYLDIVPHEQLLRIHDASMKIGRASCRERV